MATYNGALFLESQMQSILPQLSDDDEIIISDDGSTDNTLEIIAGFHDGRIRVLHNQGKNNPIDNFENAMRQARGEYIFLADQDDVWSAQKVQVCLHALQENDLVVSDCTIIDSCGRVVCDSFFSLKKPGRGLWKNVLSNSYIGCCMAFNRHILEKALPFPPALPMHDWWIGLVAELCGVPFFCPEKLVEYRRHKANTSPYLDKSKYRLHEKISFRLHLIAPLYRLWRAL
jgi:glycosyltransferase involved in cell wall biosynthesis